jgi:hypothetical protein
MNQEKEKRVIGILVIAMLLALCAVVFVDKAFAFQNEPTGFRGYKWGTKIGDIPIKMEKVKSIEEIKVDVYRVSGSPAGIKEMVVTLDSMLVGVAAKLEQETLVREMAKALLGTYGKPTDYTDESAVWRGEITIIEFVPAAATLTIGSRIGMESVEALLEWYMANNNKRAI